jgi:hypothetical protein
LAITSALYWYYGFFGVLAGGLILGTRTLKHRVPLHLLSVFAGVYVALIALPLWWFASHFTVVPGVAEAAFPHPEAVRDALVFAFPFTISSGRFVIQALPAVVGLGVLLRLYQLLRQPASRDWKDAALIALGLSFLLLALGPRASIGPLGSPFEWVYGLAAPLRRFWWPSRHIVVANLAWSLLAARALPTLSPGRELGAGVLLFGAVFASLHLQGIHSQVQVTRLEGFPSPFYESVRALEGDVAITLPLAPEVAASQRHLLYQRTHQKHLLTGHALWVDRIRPAEWDTFVAQNSLLSGIQALERGTSNTLEVKPADLRKLVAEGVGVIVLNQEHYPARLEEVAKRDRAALTALFGDPALEGDGMWAWSLEAPKDDELRVTTLSPWTWPPDLKHRADDTPVSRHTVRSTVFRPVQTAPTRPGSSRKAP